ncbi:MAG: AarF/UbiB family protein [Acidobacteriota bacterium]
MVGLLSLPLRAVEISFHAARHGLRWSGRSLKRRLTGRGPSSQRLFGELITDLAESLGATFVKMGQILSSRPDLLPPEVIAPLSRLQENVRPFDARRVPRLLERAFGRPFDQLFEDFDLDPLSAASIAQVHSALLSDGRRVAVKIRRPGLERKVRDDFRLLGLFAAAVDWLPAMRTVPLRMLIDEIGGPVREQLDLAREAENNRRFRKNFEGADYVRFPVLVEELCCESVLTMELLEDLKKVDDQTVPQEERVVAATAGLRGLYRMIFHDGFVHADMHPGNVFLRQWGEFIILDLGLVAALDDDDLQHFVDFFFGMVNNKGRECARVVIDTAIHLTADFDREAFDQAMIEMIDSRAKMKASDFEVSGFAFDLFNTQRRHGVRGSTKFTMVLLSLIVFEGIVKQLDPERDFQSEARGYLVAAKFRRRLAAAG